MSGLTSGTWQLQTDAVSPLMLFEYKIWACIDTHSILQNRALCKTKLLPVTHDTRVGGYVHVNSYTYKPTEMCIMTGIKLQTHVRHLFSTHD